MTEQEERWQMEVCSCGKPTYDCQDRRHKRTRYVEVVPASRVQELEGERERLKAHIRAAITAYATDGSTAEDALLDIEAAL